MSLWDKCVLGRGHSRGKGPKSLACSRNWREISVAGMEWGAREGDTGGLGHRCSQGQIRWGPADSCKFCLFPWAGCEPWLSLRRHWDDLTWVLFLLFVKNRPFKIFFYFVLIFGSTSQHVHACVLSHFSHDWLFVTLDCSHPGSSVHGILQARILECIVISSSRGSSQPRDWTRISYISCIGRWVLHH